jgi:hypothetical protein
MPMSVVESFSSNADWMYLWVLVLAHHQLGLLRKQPPTALAIAKPLRNTTRCRSLPANPAVDLPCDGASPGVAGSSTPEHTVRMQVV